VIYPSGQSQVIQIGGLTSTAALVALASDTTKYVSISISGITNPNTVGVTTTFQIATMDSNKKLIDRVLTGLYVNITEPGTLTINTFLASSKVVDAASYLTFDVTPSVYYSSGGYIEVVAPYPYITETLSSGTICQA
jgi:predicted transcriptional regulator of viral defense system